MNEKKNRLSEVVKPENVITLKSEISNRLITNRGVLIIALGNPQYGRMAANLASSIRFADKDIKIHLVWSGVSISHLTDAHKALFTSMQECPVEYYTKNGKTVYIKAKTCMYDLSPFDETLFLDSDMILVSDKTFKNVSTIFESLKGVDFTFQNRDYFDLSKEVLNEKYSMWCNIKEAKEKYFANGIEPGTGKYYSLHSEFVYFKKNDKNAYFFKLAKEIFDNPKVKGADWGGDIPDELAFAIAMAVTGHYPHKDGYLPIHWFAAENKRMATSEIATKFYGLSIGGHSLPAPVKASYEMLAKAYARLLGLPYFFKVHSKKSWLPERVKM